MPETTEVSKDQTREDALSDYLKVSIAPDRLSANITRREGSELLGDILSVEELESYVLTTTGLTEVNSGLLADVIDSLENYETVENVVIADHGQAPERGKDGELQLLLNDEADSGKQRQRLMMADFHPVKTGEEFALLVQPTKGTHGQDICGEIIPAIDGDELVMKPGHGAEFDKETNVFSAQIDGRIELNGELVCVSRVLEIAEDAEPAAGTIEFNGMINVGGCVRDGAKLVAEEGICVRGLVEGAELHAGGSVALDGGFNGGDEGILECEGDLSGRFLNNASVMVRGDISIEREIVSSEVHGRSIDVSSGSISGGRVSALNNIIVGEAGNENGILTVICVSVDMHKERERDQVQSQIEKVKNGLKKIGADLKFAKENQDRLSPELQQNIKFLSANAERFKKSLDELNERFKELRRPNNNRDGEIIVLQIIHPGTVCRIGRYEKRISKKYEGRRRIYFDADKYEVMIGV
ncbi:MAG: FapA family protein [Planctomycetes bacterium]|nr:FapA family protein [Planctomycetota bacterium]